jgi:hypothetical protein
MSDRVGDGFRWCFEVGELPFPVEVDGDRSRQPTFLVAHKQDSIPKWLMAYRYDLYVFLDKIKVGGLHPPNEASTDHDQLLHQIHKCLVDSGFHLHAAQGLRQ